MAGNQFEVWFTGTTPQNIRQRLLNCEPEDTILVGIWFSQSWRLDVYIGDTYIEPKNADGEVNNYSSNDLLYNIVYSYNILEFDARSSSTVVIREVSVRIQAVKFSGLNSKFGKVKYNFLCSLLI